MRGFQRTSVPLTEKALMLRAVSKKQELSCSFKRKSTRVMCEVSEGETKLCHVRSFGKTNATFRLTGKKSIRAMYAVSDSARGHANRRLRSTNSSVMPISETPSDSSPKTTYGACPHSGEPIRRREEFDLARFEEFPLRAVFFWRGTLREVIVFQVGQ